TTPSTIAIGGRRGKRRRKSRTVLDVRRDRLRAPNKTGDGLEANPCWTGDARLDRRAHRPERGSSAITFAKELPVPRPRRQTNCRRTRGFRNASSEIATRWPPHSLVRRRTAAGTLSRLLHEEARRQGIPLVFGKRLHALEITRPDSVRATFVDGSSAEAA